MKSYLYVFGFLLVVPMLAPNPRSLRSKDPEIVRSVATSKAPKAEWEKIRVFRTFYCATSSLCRKKICGGNKKTAWGKDATKMGGIAADPRNIAYGSTVYVENEKYVVDDTFGKRRRERDWKKGISHIDIRIAGKPHKEVARMGASWITVKVLRRKNER